MQMNILQKRHNFVALILEVMRYVVEKKIKQFSRISMIRIFSSWKVTLNMAYVMPKNLYIHLALDYLLSMNICRYKRKIFVVKKNYIFFTHIYNIFTWSSFMHSIYPLQYYMHIPIYGINIFYNLLNVENEENYY